MLKRKLPLKEEQPVDEGFEIYNKYCVEETLTDIVVNTQMMIMIVMKVRKVESVHPLLRLQSPNHRSTCILSDHM